jgi:hypothetical protein
MIHSEKEVLDWLLAHCEHDRVLYNALTNHQAEPMLFRLADWWLIRATRPRTNRSIDIRVVSNPVTGEPNHYYRATEHADA